MAISSERKNIQAPPQHATHYQSFRKLRISGFLAGIYFSLLRQIYQSWEKRIKNLFYKKQLKPFLKGNRVLIAALGGAAAGITLANILGTEKARNILHTVEGSISEFTDKVSNGLTAKDNKTITERPKEAYVN